MLYERDYRSSSNLSFTFDFGKKYSNFDCHSFALSENENYLLLLGNHQLQLINFETFTTSLANLIHQDHSIIIPCSSDIHTIPLFDICNIHRPLVQWNQQEPKEYALAIDRLVRFYRIDHGRIEEINSLDSQHQVGQKEECALTGSRTRVGCLEGNHANRYTINATIAHRVSFLFYPTWQRTSKEMFALFSLASNIHDLLLATGSLLFLNRFIGWTSSYVGYATMFVENTGLFEINHIYSV